MSEYEYIREELVESGLHEESVENLLDHFGKMLFHIKTGNYEEVGLHVGKFCENIGNLIIHQSTGEVKPKPEKIRNELKKIQGDTDLPDSMRLMIPRFLEPTYDIRNRRDQVHTSLEMSVSYADSNTAVTNCSWMLAEILRTYSDADSMDKISSTIRNLLSPMGPHIDEFGNKRMIASNKLDLDEEILVLLYNESGVVESDTLVDWIPNEGPHSIKSMLGTLKSKRKIFYEEDEVKLASGGIKEAEKVIEEKLEAKN